jgi:hypothetical protein
MFHMNLRPSLNFLVRFVFLHRNEIGPPLSVTFVFLRSTQRDIIKNVHFSLYNLPVMLDIISSCINSLQLLKIFQILNFIQVLPFGAKTDITNLVVILF